jgi:hypothetical protein
MAQTDTGNSMDVLLAEFEFVSGLIRYYRDVELRALVGTGLVLSGVAAVYGALESADTPQPAAQAILLSVASWVPALLLLIVLMAKVRGLRGVFYVRDHLRPHAIELTGDDRVLGWEVHASTILFREFDRGADARIWRTIARPLMGKGVVKSLLSGMPLMVMMLVTSVGLAAGGILVDPRAEIAAIGGAAALTGVVLCALGFAFTRVTDRAYEVGRMPSADARDLVTDGPAAMRVD